MSLPKWYQEYKYFVEEAIDIYLKLYLAIPGSKPTEEFKEVIHYALKWWKKLRSILALEFYLTLTEKTLEELSYTDDIVKLCIAIEVMHAFSLIHDDLPCMDNDELRRGEPTVWKKFGEYTATLAGDMLSCLTFEIISEMKDPYIVKLISKHISHSVWFYGMVWGQVEDMYFEKHISDLDYQTLLSLHGKKTGKLIEAAIICGCILSEETANLENYWKFAQKLGLAFQIKDDILDVEGTPEETGKSVWGEEKGFVYLLWMEESKAILHREIQDCKDIISALPSEKIHYLVDFIASRKK